MSKLIKNFKPPVIKKDDLENGVRYLVDNPEQKDPLGQVLAVGDLVIYGGTGDSSGNLRYGKIIGIYTKITPQKGLYKELQQQYPDRYPDRVETKIAVAMTGRWKGSSISRQSTDRHSVVKVNEAIFSQSPELLRDIQEC